MSCQPDRTAAYNEDLRWRMIYQHYGLELSYRKIADLSVDPSTVQHTVQHFEETGTVSKAAYPKGHSHPFKKLTEIDEFLILELVLERPGIYLDEIKSLVNRLEQKNLCPQSATFCIKTDLRAKS